MRLALRNQNIIVGITGGIAAYKSAELVRLLIKAGAVVRVVMTPAAKAFITPLTLQALTGHPVHDALLDEQAEQGMGHIELARWADFILIAPASADVIARLNAGFANDLLTTVCLASNAPIAIAPAMNEKMWHNPVTQHNVMALSQKRSDIHWLGPASGEQACGDVGQGRMLEPSDILKALSGESINDKPLCGNRVVMTAGPTQEPIDPVRYLSNHSSGKMGYALASEAAIQGADVLLISGPTDLTPPKGVRIVHVRTADEMLNAALEAIAEPCDVFIASAAVADYRPQTVSEKKLKKSSSTDLSELKLVQNPDIVATIAKHDHRPDFVVAFAAETDNVMNHAQAKLETKKVDAVVANDVSQAGLGFGADNNQVYWLDHAHRDEFGPASKSEVARYLLKKLNLTTRKP